MALDIPSLPWPLFPQAQQILIYDCETRRPVRPNRDTDLLENIEYADHWSDYRGMGISLISTLEIDSRGVQLRQFEERDLAEFIALLARSQVVVGMNSTAFDDNLLCAHGVPVLTDYDLLLALRLAAGEPAAHTRGVTRSGRNLEALARANGWPGKTQTTGALAPVLFQRGQLDQLRSYGEQDVRLVARAVCGDGHLIDPASAASVKLPNLEAYRQKVG